MMSLIMLSCKKATLLIEKKLSTNLSIKEKIELKMHTSLCKACANYEQQGEIIDELLQKQIQDDETIIDEEHIISNQELKNRIIENFN